VANRLLKRVRDYASVHHIALIDISTVHKTLEMLEVDHLGLEQPDRRLLGTLIAKFGGGPVGLHTLAAGMNDDPNTIEDVYEPYLLRMGLLDRTSSGRVATLAAYEHLRAIPPGGKGLGV
jgi:Holliday junction DNA helicase RuvB